MEVALVSETSIQGIDMSGMSAIEKRLEEFKRLKDSVLEDLEEFDEGLTSIAEEEEGQDMIQRIKEASELIIVDQRNRAEMAIFSGDAI